MKKKESKKLGAKFEFYPLHSIRCSQEAWEELRRAKQFSGVNWTKFIFWILDTWYKRK